MADTRTTDEKLISIIQGGIKDYIHSHGTIVDKNMMFSLAKRMKGRLKNLIQELEDENAQLKEEIKILKESDAMTEVYFA